MALQLQICFKENQGYIVIYIIIFLLKPFQNYCATKTKTLIQQQHYTDDFDKILTEPSFQKKKEIKKCDGQNIENF